MPVEKNSGKMNREWTKKDVCQSSCTQ